MLRVIAKLITLLALICTSVAASADCVVVLHGLGRTSHSMEPIASGLTELGYTVANVDYPSRHQVIERLAPLALGKGIAACPGDGQIHFVSHSLGGVLIRYYLERNELPRLGRVVMIAPPNNGSQVVDKLRKMPGFSLVTGPAGYQLGTDSKSVPMRLGPVDFELGVIAGTKSRYPILSSILPNPDDGMVSVASTKIPGMSDFIEVPHTHGLIMRAPDVLNLTAAFIESGLFRHATL